ncbi:hypothetical protein ASZ78_015788 [Callipepla squamata]|uniref:Sushi domain-containing protein n=1 Tax=Callipepla squamata TaxID=9009 RepID=A0A226NIF0_CALSU|nr:hypothetical protein ASZ78_015788 [Callipepla squamata]
MVLTFTLRILGCSALLLAAVSGQQEVMCLQPPNIANGLHSGQSMDKFLPGAIVYYSCKDGFELIGNVSISCSEVGRWSRPLPRCQAIGCQRPTVHNGKVQAPQDAYAAGEMLWFDCDPGYAAEGNYQARCQPGGSWDPPVLSCERVRPCPSPPKISNGDHDGHGKAEFTMGMYVTYTCNVGYFLAGNVGRVFCKGSGKWSQPSPHCEEVTCPQPPNIANGLHSGSSSARFPHGTVVYYSCKDGFELIGNVSISCSEVGRWSRPLPRCQAIGCQRPTVHNGKVQAPQDAYAAGEMLWFDCDPGYAAEGSHQARCQPGGSWDPPVLSCERVRPCPMPPKISNGDHNRHGEAFFTTGMSVTYTCDPSFYLVGNAHVVCKASGIWSQPSPRCEATICLKPDIQDGWIVDDHGLIYAPGQTVMFRCRDGYTLRGSTRALCQENGSWDTPVPLCDPFHTPLLPSSAEHSGIPCEPPPSIPHGKHTGRLLDEFHYGISVTYSCEPGYPLHGNASIFCTTQDGKNGVWSSPPPRCGAGCRAPPKLLFAELKEPYRNQTAFPVGGTVEYMCRPGYTRHLGMSPTITCLRNQSWSVALDFCKRKQCANPEDPQNGRAVVLTDLLLGSKVNYTCDEGYKMSGRSQRTCELSGTRVVWSGDAPTCHQIVCDPPPDIPHGTHSGGLMDAFPYASVVTYTCEPGRVLAGTASIFCTTEDGERGAWSGPPPRCGEVQCPPPPSIANGKQSSQPDDTFLPGAVVQYSCKDGYLLIGNASITCTAAGAWSRPRPRCEAIGCRRPEIEHGRVTGPESVYRLESIAVFECDFGYALKGSQESQCRFGGTWDPPVPTCEKMLQCPSPPNITHGHYNSEDVKVFVPGMSVRYNCDPGYVLTGKTAVTCLTSGVWSIPYPRCEVVTCMNPSIKHGEVAEGQQAVYHPGTIITIRCHQGYTLRGSQEPRCHSDGRWVPSVPSCEPVGCGTPTTLQFAELNREYKNWTEFPVGTTVTYMCRPGYARHSEIPPTITCLQNQTWSEAKKFCKRQLCPSPPVIDHGQHDGKDVELFIPGMSVNYSCDPGYSLTGKAALYCTDSASWSSPQPHCEVLHCPSPPNIEGGNHNSKDVEVFLPGMAVNYSCDPGYSLLGEASIYCTESGNWSLPSPQCEGTCGAPPRLSYAELAKEHRNVTAFPVGSTVRYACRPGFMRHPTVPPALTCLENHTWSDVRAFCKRKECNYPEAPQNGRVVILTDLLFRSIVNYTCEEGYRLVGQSLRQCELSGADIAWSGDPPTCQKVVCPVPQIQNGNVSVPKYRYRYKDTVSFQCHEGFILRGHSTAQCKADKTWDPPVPTCEQVVKCLPPPSITNGEHSSFSDTFGIGAIVHYRCKPGFVLIGNKSVHCTPHGVWSRPFPRCEVGCVSPGVGHGKAIGLESLYVPGDIITIECNTDNIPKVLHKSQCQSGGTWFPPLPTCDREISCVFPEVQGVKKTTSGKTYRFGTNVTLECDDGYTLEGLNQIQCQEDFSWDPPVPACKLTSPRSGSVGLGIAAAVVLLLLGVAIGWKIISKQKEGYYRTYENYSYRNSLD